MHWRWKSYVIRCYTDGQSVLCKQTARFRFGIPITRSRNTGTLTPMMMKPGTTKDHPQGPSQVAQMAGMTVPRMLPTGMLEFQIPMIRPRLARKIYALPISTPVKSSFCKLLMVSANQLGWPRNHKRVTINR